MRMLQQVFREFSIDWILHCNVRMFSMDMWTWAMDLHSHQDMVMYMGTSRQQWCRSCTWRDARLERAMS